MSEQASGSTSNSLATYEECVRREHPIVDLGGPWYCKLCHVRTDDAFAAWSREQLERYKQRQKAA